MPVLLVSLWNIVGYVERKQLRKKMRVKQYVGYAQLLKFI